MTFICWIASILIFLISIAIFAVVLLVSFDHKIKIAPLSVLTKGSILAVLLLHFPLYVTDWASVPQSILLTIFDTMRFFSMGSNYDKLAAAAVETFPVLTERATFYVAFLRLFAPILTFTNVVSIFSDTMEMIQLAVSGRRTLYILSSLNPNSMAIAQSICGKGDPKRLIIFTNMSESIEEHYRELCVQAKAMGALCLKKDITELNIRGKQAKVEFFLISDDQGLNMEHVAKLNQKHRNSPDLEIRGDKLRQRITIYLYSASPAAQSIVDSLDKGPHQLNKKFLEEAKNNKSNKVDLTKLQDLDMVLGSYSIKCVDPIQECVMNVLREEGGSNAFADPPVVSIAVVGQGNFGRHFVKNAAWFYQLQGFDVHITVFDKDPDAEKRLIHECPELIGEGAENRQGEDSCRINCYSGVDCFTSDFDEKLQNDPILQKARIVFVALGNDDANIAAAMMIRTRFNRLHKKEGEGAPVIPRIYAVIRDEQIVDNLESAELKDHKGEPTEIEFVGTYSNQFSYSVCTRLNELEKEGFINHINWQNVSEYTKKYEQNTKNYTNYSYFRKSSTSRAMHEKMVDAVAEEKGIVFDKATTEHMRWNAYMRSIGYCYAPETDHSAKLHQDLVNRDALTDEEQRKDLRSAAVLPPK